MDLSDFEIIDDGNDPVVMCDSNVIGDTYEIIDTQPANEEYRFAVTAWPGDYGLESMDIECNKLILYMRFTQAKFKVIHPRSLAWKDGELPYLHQYGHGASSYSTSTYARCVEDLRFQRYSLDFGLSFRSCSEIHAFSVMTQRMLGPVLEFLFWIDCTNFNELTRLWYSKQILPLVNVWYIQQRKQKALDVIKAQENLDETQEFCMVEYFRRHARDCFHMLSVRLGSGEYFFDSGPSSLDVVVYACLAPIIKIPWPSDEIPKILKTYPNLLDYVLRIDVKYQPDLVNAIPRVLPLKGVNDDDDMETSLKLKVFSSVFVACAMVGYALANKIVMLN